MKTNKRGRRLTRQEKIILAAADKRINVSKWVVVGEDDVYIQFRNRDTGKVKTLIKK